VLLGSAGIFAGWQPLFAAGETRHTVVKGDSLSAIAKRYGTSVAALKSVNNLKSDLIIPGQHLVIPTRGAGVKAPALPASVIAAIESVRVSPGRWKYIVGHHSGIEQGNAKIYDRGHRERGMEHGLAYHFVIGNGRDSGDGQVEIGPRWVKQLRGGHVRRTEVNDVGIGICVVGNFQNRRPSTRQMAAFTALVDHLGTEVVNNRWKFMVHREVDRNHTVCPGRNFPIRQMHDRFDRYGKSAVRAG
jgi:LysM repeat protein